MAARHGSTGKAQYLLGMALLLPLPTPLSTPFAPWIFCGARSRRKPPRYGRDSARVLKPGGTFFFNFSTGTPWAGW